MVPRRSVRRALLLLLAAVVLLPLAPVAPPVAGRAAAPAPAAQAGDGARTSARLDLATTQQRTLYGTYLGDGPREAFSTPAIADLTGDHVPELVSASLDGRVVAYRMPSMSVLWVANLGSTAIQASPVVADVTGDARPEVVVGTMNGRVVVLAGGSGGRLVTMREGAPLHCPVGVDCRPHGFFATPAVGDVDGDGRNDIVAASYDHSVYAWTGSGRLIFRRYLEDTLWSSPVIADIDRNGTNEIVLGGDIWAGNPFGAPAGGLVWVLNRNGSTYAGYPRWMPGQTVWSSPAVADVDRDGWQDIVVGSGTNWPDPAGRKVDVFTATTRRSHPGWPVPTWGRVMDSPAVGDVDGDGTLEVAFASEGSYVYVHRANGARLWAACNGWQTSGCTAGGSGAKGGVVIADVDGDGRQEVVSTLEPRLRVYDGPTGLVEATSVLGDSTYIPPPSSPSVVDVEGSTYIVQQSIVKTGSAHSVARAGDKIRLHVLTTGHELCRADWPSFHGDAARGGRPAGTRQWAPMRCPGNFVAQQYRDFLGIEAGAGDRVYWTRRFHHGDLFGPLMLQGMLTSATFRTSTEPVVRAHLGTFGTPPRSVDAVQSYALRVRSGTPIAEIADEMAEAPAVVDRTDEEYVRAIFANLYGRAPTTEELRRDTWRLANGTTRGTLLVGYSDGSAARPLTAKVHVSMAYLAMLRRGPDSGGFAYWVKIANAWGPTPMLHGFQHSSEYARRVASLG